MGEVAQSEIAKSLQVVSDEVAKLLLNINEGDAFAGSLIHLVKAVIPCSFGYVLHYPEDGLPDVIFPVTYSPPRGFTNGLFVLDPLWQAFRNPETDQRRGGTHSLLEVAPAEFEETDYFKHVYAAQEIVDEQDHVIMAEDESQSWWVFGFCRSNKYKPFSRKERALHQAIHPLVAQAAQRLQKLIVNKESKTGRLSRQELQIALENFGSNDGLTPREREVVQLVLLGHNNQSVAAQLSISGDTVKLHRKHIYSKLKVGSQGELFFRFLESIGFKE